MESPIISVIGLGYVGLPLAVEFAKKYPVIGFDIDATRVSELRDNIDRTREVGKAQLKKVLHRNIESVNAKCGLLCTGDQEDLKHANVYIVTVPTPTDIHKRPVLTPLISASTLVAKYLAKGDIVIYESTVYPGVTEDVCVPLLEDGSQLRFNQDFFVGYSPERINPGDKIRTVTNILKVTSGSTPESAARINKLYQSIIPAGTHLAPTIKVAEAAKVIENSQRDINIAFVNELAKIFNKLGIDTHAVLEAASTKWNFLPFKPGLVGGHCIGVDPYYLAQKAQEVGYHPEIILGGRRLNDGMGEYVADSVLQLLINNSLLIRNSKVLVLGLTFKENCPDIRNTKVIDVVNKLKFYKLEVDVMDPCADPSEVEEHFGITLAQRLDQSYEAIILAVAHDDFIGVTWRDYLTDGGVIYDVKGVLDLEMVDGRL